MFGDFAVMLTGDAEAEVDHELLEAGLDLSAQVLKMGHHGSRTSSSLAFVEAVQPEIAVYQAGKGNNYGHPHEETLASVAAVSATVYGNDRHGTIVIETDGQAYTVAVAHEALGRAPPEVTPTR